MAGTITIPFEQFEQLRDQRNALLKFKIFVHEYLTRHGVPEDDPTNPHSKEGCRVGARLDLLRASRDDPQQRAAAHAELDRSLTNWQAMG